MKCKTCEDDCDWCACHNGPETWEAASLDQARELEAVTVRQLKEQERTEHQLTRQRLRAEKAEAESEGLKGRLSALQARVAELEKERHELRLAVFDTETLRVKEREEC